MIKLKKVGQEFLSWKWTLWILFLFPYGWNIQSNLAKIQGIQGVSINLWDFIIEFIFDPFLFIYFLFPIFLFLFSKVILQNWEYTILHRVRSYTGWILYTVGKIIPSIVVFLLIWIFIGYLITLPLPFQLSWSEYATNDLGIINYLVFGLQQHFSKPYFSVLVQLLQYFSFLITVHIVIATFYLFRPKNSTLTIVVSCFFFGTIISYKRLDWIWLQIQNYVLTYYNVGNFNSFYIPLFILPIIFIICLLVVKLFKK